MALWPLILTPVLGAHGPSGGDTLGASDAIACPAAVDYGRRGLGAMASPTTGVSFVWRDVRSNGLGYMAGFGISLLSHEERSGPPTLGAGWQVLAQGLKVVAQTGWWRLYALGGLQSLGLPKVQYPAPVPVTKTAVGQVPTEVPPPPPAPIWYSEHDIGLSCGLGLEFGAPPGITVAVELPLTLAYRIAPTFGLSRLAPEPRLLVLYTF